nr:MAG TPA: hypothetical protein [Caudoviricetes sp.]
MSAAAFPLGELPAILFSTSAFTAALNNLSSLLMLACAASISSPIARISANSALKPLEERTDFNSLLFFSMVNKESCSSSSAMRLSFSAFALSSPSS